MRAQALTAAMAVVDPPLASLPCMQYLFHGIKDRSVSGERHTRQPRTSHARLLTNDVSFRHS